MSLWPDSPTLIQPDSCMQAMSAAMHVEFTIRHGSSSCPIGYDNPEPDYTIMQLTTVKVSAYALHTYIASILMRRSVLSVCSCVIPSVVVTKALKPSAVCCPLHAGARSHTKRWLSSVARVLNCSKQAELFYIATLKPISYYINLYVCMFRQN
jgi:hypothetical protein